MNYYELCLNYKEIRRKRGKVVIWWCIGCFVVLLSPLLFQKYASQLPYNSQMAFYLAWYIICFCIVLCLGFRKLIKLEKSVYWSCPKCSKEMDFNVVKIVVRLGVCPFCGESVGKLDNM